MNLQKIKESITSFSIQYNDKDRGISYISMFDGDVVSNYFKLEDGIDLNDKELLENRIVEDIKTNYLRQFVKDNYEVLNLLGYIAEDKVVKELL